MEGEGGYREPSAVYEDESGEIISGADLDSFEQVVSTAPETVGNIAEQAARAAEALIDELDTEVATASVEVALSTTPAQEVAIPYRVELPRSAARNKELYRIRQAHIDKIEDLDEREFLTKELERLKITDEANRGRVS